MKTKIKRSNWILPLLFLLVLVACSKDGSEGQPEPVGDRELIVSEGVEEDDFEKFSGELGFILNTRNIAKKGYKPTKAIITVAANSGDYSRTVDLDKFSFLGQLKIPIAGLTTEAEEELRNGVPVSVDIKNENDNTIMTQNFSSILFKANPTPNMLNVSELEETEEMRTISLKEGTPYYIQKVSNSGQPTNMAMGIDSRLNAILSSNVEFTGIENDPGFVMNFTPIPGEFNTYAIRLQHNGYYAFANFDLNFVGRPNIRLSNLTSFNEVQNAPNYDWFKFKIEKLDEGIYTIKTAQNDTPITHQDRVGLIHTLSRDDVNWRILSNSIDWSAETIGTTFSNPILSSPSTDFGANSTLTNCGQGPLDEVIGSDKTIATSNTVGWEERFSFTGSITTGLSTTVGVEFEAGFFGTSATYTGEVTASLETSVSMTDESTEFGETTTSSEESLFFERTVTVPAGAASLVYDVAQIYDDVKVQFVQRIRLRATESGNALSGEEIRSQLQFSKFSGVVSQVGSDFVDITIKGTSKLANILELRTTVQDVPAACN